MSRADGLCRATYQENVSGVLAAFSLDRNSCSQPSLAAQVLRIPLLLRQPAPGRKKRIS